MVPMKAKKPTKLSDQLRQILLDSGLTRYAIAKQSGVTQASLSRFASGERGLTTDSLDALADTLGLELVAKRPAKGKARKGKQKGR